MISPPTSPRSANRVGSEARVGETNAGQRKARKLIRSAWDDGAPCLVATQGPNGPNISPKAAWSFSTMTISPIGSARRSRRYKTLAMTDASA